MKKNRELLITTLIGAGAECDGDFSAKGSARIDGSINGNVTVSGTLIIGVSGVINGDISANSAIIGGEVNGDITVAEKVELTYTAKVVGDITTQTIVIDEKALFQGGCNMNLEDAGRRPKPAGRTIRAGKRTAKEAIEEALKEAEAAEHGPVAAETDSSAQTQQAE